MRARDEIHIANLEVHSAIGVTEAERQAPQRLTVSLTLRPSGGFEGVGDDLENTVDYSAVCKLVRRLAEVPGRRLIETFAGDIADAVLGGFACDRVAVELRKYILADTDYVAVRLSRQREGAAPQGPPLTP